jgi:hypothetical protein
MNTYLTYELIPNLNALFGILLTITSVGLILTIMGYFIKGEHIIKNHRTEFKILCMVFIIALLFSIFSPNRRTLIEMQANAKMEDLRNE